jgi:hypothetical protein
VKNYRFSIINSVAGSLIFLSVLAYGQEGVQGPPPTPVSEQMSAPTPPVGQPLVPEGALAVQLVEALKIGATQDEAQAESLLSAIGIEPKNGWIAGYPVTPPIIFEIEKGVAAAADAGKLGLRKDQALKAVGDLKVKMGLNVRTGEAPPSSAQTDPGRPPGNTVIYKYIDKSGVVYFTDRYESIPKEYRNQVKMIRETVQPQGSEQSSINEGTMAGDEEPRGDRYTANPGAEVINNYYDYDGPPVVTYYAPPAPYYYLYSWVPYPFWYSSFYFPRYYILHGFHRRVYWNNRSYAVTNYVGRGFGGRGGVVDPVHRNLSGGVIPNRATQAFHSPGGQTSARQIAGLSQSRISGAPPAARMSHGGSGVAMSRPSGGSGSNPGGYGGRAAVSRSNGGPSQVSGGGAFSPTGDGGRSYSSVPRVYSAASLPSGRSSLGGYHGGGGAFGGSHGGVSSFGASRGAASSFGGYHGGSHGGGGSRGGSGSGGRR